MSESQQRQPGGRPAAVLVLVVALAATFFGTWREREIARRGEVIRWQDSFAQLQPVLAPLLGHRFEILHNQARSTLRRKNVSAASWEDFLTASEWRQRFPGMMEIGFAEFDGDQCTVKFVASERPPSTHGPGFDLNRDPIIRDAIQKSADTGYGIPSREISPGGSTNSPRVIIGLLPLQIHDGRPGTATESRTNLQRFIFFALNQPEYFRSIQPQLKSMPLDLKLLAPGETAPPRTPTQRPFSNTGASGEWRFVATMKPSPASANASQWIVLIGGSALSFLLCFLFAAQARLRLEAEQANENILQRDAEINSLNRDLEGKITARTAELNEALAEEKELNRLKSNFISMVTHEIRTPLALILGASEILSRYLDRLAPEKRTGHLRTIDSAVQRMSALLEDVLLFSKAEAGRMD
ncbi:MAG: hypothetical protein JWR69_4374, partial [Pedosphaera sp.]|nr:hypothetical protein [Pedosphaera sp.]